MAERAGVRVHLHTRATAGSLIADHPDAIIVATGSTPMTIPLPGRENARWLLATAVLEGTSTVETETVFVIGGGLIGLETADCLAAQGKQVTLVEMLPEVGADMDRLSRSVLLKRLGEKGVEMHTGTTVTRLTASAVVAEVDGQETRFPVETVVMAVGMAANRELAEGLEGSGIDYHVVGDAVEPRQALDAIWEAFEVGTRL